MIHAVIFDIDDTLLHSMADDSAERVGIMLHALGSLEGRFESVTYYGDGVWDQRACRQLGWEFRAVGPALDGILGYDGEFADL